MKPFDLMLSMQRQKREFEEWLEAVRKDHGAGDPDSMPCPECGALTSPIRSDRLSQVVYVCTARTRHTDQYSHQQCARTWWRRL